LFVSKIDGAQFRGYRHETHCSHRATNPAALGIQHRERNNYCRLIKIAESVALDQILVIRCTLKASFNFGHDYFGQWLPQDAETPLAKPQFGLAGLRCEADVCKLVRWKYKAAESDNNIQQLICNQQVIGSNPIAGSLLKA
jgi:hypothetical protein